MLAMKYKQYMCQINQTTREYHSFTHPAPIFVKSLFVWKVYAVRPPVMSRVMKKAFTTTSASYILTATPTVTASTTVNAANNMKLMGTWCLPKSIFF